MEEGIGSIAENATEDGRSGQARGPCDLYDRLVQGFPVKGIAIADEHSKQLTFTFDLHRTLPVCVL